MFSGGACKKETCRGNCLAEGLSRISHAGRMCLAEALERRSHAGGNCLAEVLSRISHAGKISLAEVPSRIRYAGLPRCQSHIDKNGISS